MKKTIKIIALLLIVALFSIFLFSCKKPTKEENYVVKNVILMIGDGMGKNHIEATRLYLGKEKLNMETLDYQGDMSTYCLFFNDKCPITDSAASATALATGEKAELYTVGIKPNYSNYENVLKAIENIETDHIVLKNVTEHAIETGRRTGIVATKDLCDATPAGFSAHVLSRKNYDEISLQQVNSNIDILIGQGYTEYYERHKQTLIDKGYTIATTADELAKANTRKVFGGYNSITPSSDNNFEFLVTQSLRLLDNENGFFAMFEGSKIDSRAHSNDIAGIIEETTSFDNAIGIVLEWMKDNPDTLLIVTADHETGGLALGDGFSKGVIGDYSFSTGGHTSADVKYFMKGKGAEIVPAKIDNTDIAKIIFKALG